MVRFWRNSGPARDPFDLRRFLEAQETRYQEACSELERWFKTGHWMWYIFPQMRGLGNSEYANRFGISSRAEAEAYALHPVLGERLRKCSGLVTKIEGRTIEQIFDHPDYLKFFSSMTLFADASSDNTVFVAALKKYFDGKRDPATIQLLGKV